VSILQVGLALRSAGEEEFHGFALARALRERDHARSLTAHGTLYKALERLERAGLLESRWEEPELAAAGRRPRRRLYRVTGLGERAHGEAVRHGVAPVPRAGLATS
jgi:DNA-binding PadR family transcriptional regulator